MANARVVVAAVLKRQIHSRSTNINPWFVAPTVPDIPQDAKATSSGRQQTESSPTIPDEVPSYLKSLHSVLQTSPLLEPSQLLVRRPLSLGEGPGLPRQRTRGTRRKRKQTFAGLGIEQANTLWDWAVYAQVKQPSTDYKCSDGTSKVKEGTENRGSIEAVLKSIRSTVIPVI